MSVPNKFQANDWSKTIKSQIQGLANRIIDVQDDEDIPIEVRPPEFNRPFKQKARHNDSMSLYLNRVRHRNVQKTINLVQQNQPIKPLDVDDNLQRSVNIAASSKLANGALTHRKKDQLQEVSQVIDLERADQKKNLKFKNPIQPKFNNNQKWPAVDQRNSKQRIASQISSIDQLNQPEWLKQKEKRRENNKKKYPNSNHLQYNFSNTWSTTGRFSGMNEASDRNHKDYLQKQEQFRQKNKQQKIEQRKRKKQEQALEKKRQFQRKLAEDQAVLRGLVDMDPKKKVKTDQLSNLDNGNEQLGNMEALNLIAVEEENYEGVKQVYKKSKTRVGAKDKILFQTSAPNFISMILQHKYGQESMKLQTKKIPDYFIDIQTYKHTFHYLISNQCIAEIRHKLRTIQKTGPQCLKISIQFIRIDPNDGMVELSIQQKEIQKNGAIELKNFSLSRNRLGLICSSRQYRNEYYGTSLSKNKKQLAFLVLLVTPTTNDELGKEVKARAKIKARDLQQFLEARQEKTLYFFDLQKISTNLREYLAVTNVKCSQLVQSILDPSLADAESQFVGNKEILKNILENLKGIYNQTQWLSIKQMVLRQRGFLLLQGPPGTGKTSTLMGLLAAQYQYLRKTQDKRKIMICAPSNAAVDHIAKRIINQGLLTGEGKIVHPTILRTGIVETIDQSVRAISLDDQCQKIMLADKEEAEKLAQMSTPQIKQKLIQIQKEIRRLTGNSNKKNELAAKKQQSIQLQRQLFNFKRIKYISSKANYTNIQNKLFNEAQIVLTTLSSSGNDKIDKIRGEIACLIVDEAAQATQPNLLIALQTGVEKVLLIGDPYQLPATCISNDSNITLFNRSLFERFLDANIKPYFLNIQYRMSPAIRAFPSSRFYQDRLKDADIVKQRSIPQFLKNFQERNVLFIDLKYGREDRKGDSFWNNAQAKVISLLIRCLMDTSVTLGLITPYQSQKKAIFRDCMDALRGHIVEQQYLQKQIMINTVDSFQGQEKDVIIVSTVRANSNYNVGFLKDQRRINVTVTRAKHLLIVIGHADTLGSNEVWDDFLTWTEKRNCYYQIASEKNMEDVVGFVFQEFNYQQIRRKKHTNLSTDIRNLHRNQIQSVDFKSKKDAQFEKFIRQKEKRQSERSFNSPLKQIIYERQEKRKPNKYAMDIEQSQKILEEKRKKQAEQLNYQQAMARMRKFQQQNQDFLK